ncbi:unnamed protein product, partial [marine sediment metagenome]
RIDIEPVDHWSPVYNRDLWDQTTPKGKKYGFLRVFPEAGSGIYDGVLHGRTTSDGLLWVYAGLGDPEATLNPIAPLDPDYQWPGPGGSYSDCVDTVVQLKMTSPGRLTPVQPLYGWCNYLRVQYQNFWWPEGAGVYHWSYQGLGKKARPSSMIQSDGPTTIEQAPEMFDLSLFDSPAPKLTPSNYPRVTPPTKRSLIDFLTGMFARAMTYVTTSGVTLDSLDLTQLRWVGRQGKFSGFVPGVFSGCGVSERSRREGLFRRTPSVCIPILLMQ